ncbi:hypothetical protein AYO47_00435 [Planctomyces sp. SCGC AG-212-M04]|nr:hypothetical protein AYO47_00435 [Planctomyces sp. SCGC AG-212-M04]
MLTLAIALGGMAVGGFFGFLCGYLVNVSIGHSQWIRSNGLFFDLMATFVALAPLIGPAVGALAGGLAGARWVRGQTEPSPKVDPRSDQTGNFAPASSEAALERA